MTDGVVLRRLGPPLWRRREALLCLAVIALDALVITGLLVERRFPRTHDGYEILLYQYYLLNGTVTAGHLPQWVPFMSQGVDATWMYVLSATLFQHTLYVLSPLLHQANFLWLFYLGAFVDELVLLAGVWLLARRFLVSPLAVAVVAVAALGSTVWMDQPWLNFQVSRSIPLILVLLHEFVERSRWRYLAAAGNLLALQMLANMIYALPVTTFVIALYVGSWLAVDPAARRSLVRLRFGWPAVGALAVTAVSLALVAFTMTAGTDQLVAYTFGRDADRRTPLEVFLRYGGNIAARKWLELGLRVSPAIDYTLYVGIMTLPLAAIGICLNVTRANVHLLIVFAVTFLFGTGTVVATAVYHIWPGMPYFRHIGVVSAFPKLLLCFLAGLGVDAILRGSPDKTRARWLAIVLGAVAALSATAGCGLAFVARRGDVARLIRRIVDGPGAYQDAVLGETAMRTAVTEAAVLSMLAAVLLLGMIIARLRRPLVVVALGLLALDVFSYKAAQSRLQAFPLTLREYAFLAFEPIPWIPRRCPVMPCRPNARFWALRPWTIPPSENYWNTSAFVYEEELGSSRRALYWLRPFDDVLRAYAGQSMSDKRLPPAGWLPYGLVAFPQHPAAEKLAGRTEDKIQFFSAASVVPDPERVAVELRRPDATGDVLFLRPLGVSREPPTTTGSGPGLATPPSTRLHLPYQVEHFDADNLVVSVDAGATTTAWLMYSDAWHPDWRATVNGRPVPVFQANLAYKAVRLDHGRNRVHFHFAIPRLAPARLVLAVNALAWLGALAVAFMRTFRAEADRAPRTGRGDG